MPRASRAVLVAGAVVAAGLCLFPPWREVNTIAAGRAQTTTPMGYAPVWRAPIADTTGLNDRRWAGVEIDVPRFLAGVAVAALVSGATAGAAALRGQRRAVGA